MRTVLVIVSVLGVLLLGVGLAGPVVAERAADRALATMPDYEANVADADVSLLRGVVAFDGVTVWRPGVDPPYLSVDRVEFRPLLRELLRGNNIADVVIDGLVVNYVVGVDAAHSQTAIDADWLREQVERFPSTVDELAVRSGAVHYRDHAASPDVHLVVDGLVVEGSNLANTAHSDEPLFGRLAGGGRVEGGGRFGFRMKVDPYAEAPWFVLDSRVEGVPLTALDDLLRAYASFDAEAGTFTVDTHLEARDGRYWGVARPAVEGVEVVARGEAREDRQGPLQSVWEAVVGTGKDVAEGVTPGEDTVALDVKFAGEFDQDPAALKVLDALPRAWFGALSRALRVGGEATEEAVEAAVETGRAAEPERADRPKRRDREPKKDRR